MRAGRAQNRAFVFGHENRGVVVEVGPGVATVKKGDRVNLPFNIGCGFCFNCERGYTGFCLTVNPGFAGGAYGYVSIGPYLGGQAEYLLVPFADWSCLQLPKGSEHETDFATLSDIFPTGYHGATDGRRQSGRHHGRVRRRSGRHDGRILQPDPGGVSGLCGRSGA
jgi:threonine dehydrogenase-like Zn-dependent dehydrogenase